MLKLHLLGTVLFTSFQMFPRVYSQGTFTIIQNRRSGKGSPLHYFVREREALERRGFSLNVTERNVTSWDQTQVVWILTDMPVSGDVVCSGGKRTFGVDAPHPGPTRGSALLLPIPVSAGAPDASSVFCMGDFGRVSPALRGCFSLSDRKGGPGPLSSALGRLLLTG